MAVTNPPAFLQGGTYSALSDRLHLVTARVLRDPTTGVEARQGMFPDRYAAYTNPSAMDIVVGPGAGVIRNTFGAAAGDYAFVNPTNTTVTLAAASPTLNRHDIIGFQVRDAFYSGTDTDVILTAIQGTGAAGVPSDPVLPGSFLPIVRAVVNANNTSPASLQDLRAKTIMSGGVMPVGSNTERTSLGTQSSGTPIYRTDGLRIETANGAGGWNSLTVPVVATVAALPGTFPNPTADMLAWVTEVKGLYVYSDGTWQHHRSSEPSGKLWSTAGNQAIGAGVEAVIVMNQSRLRGGVTANLAAGKLTIPDSGFYVINYAAPVSSGGTGRVQAAVYRTRSGVGSLSLHAAGEHKGDTVTYWLGGVSPEIPLQAADEIDLRVLNSGASSLNVSRVGETGSALVQAKYIRALEGASPV